MEFIRRSRKYIISLYSIYVLIILTGVGLSLYKNWQDRIHKEGQELFHNNRIVANDFQHTVIDGTRLLEVAKRDIDHLVTIDSLNAETAHNVLARTLNSFQLFNPSEIYGLLMYVNAEGILTATSNSKSFEKINFSDRYYYQGLKTRPDKKFIIGPLLRARTTKQLVFHIATPILNSKNEFLGEIVIQVKVTGLSKLIEETMHISDERNDIVLDNNEIAFTYPLKLVNANSLRGQSFDGHNYIPDVELNGGWTVNQRRDSIEARTALPQLEAKTYSVTWINHIFKEFLKGSFSIVAYTLLSLAVMGYVVRKLFVELKSKHLEYVNSHTDVLTQLPNRRSLDEYFIKASNISRRSNRPLCALMIDIDHFKALNDKYGHGNGDIALKTVASVLKSSAGRPNDFCCRWGGEEFVVLLPETTLSGAEVVAAAILKNVSQTAIVIKPNQEIFITVSIGVSMTEEFNDDHSINLIDMADLAMYQAKKSGRNCYRVSTPSN